MILTGGTAAEEVSTIFGWSAAVASAIGVILGGYVSDILRQRHAAGRLYVNMAAIILPIPAVIFLFTTDSLASFYIVAPYVGMCSALWVGAAVATLQDLVLPRMRGTAGATYILGTSLVGLALGPYWAGKVAALTGACRPACSRCSSCHPSLLPPCGSPRAGSARSKPLAMTRAAAAAA